MRIPKGVRDNLRFLIAEVGSQVSHLQTFLEDFSVTVARRILDRSGYVNNLKMRIHNSCVSHIARSDAADTLSLRAAEVIATDLQRITELCRDCIQQLGYLRDRSALDCTSYTPMLEQVGKAIGLIEDATRDNDTRLALKIGRVEQKLDQAYKKLLKDYTAELKRRKNTEDLISALFVAHYVEQMGDALLSLSEAVISCNLGQPIDIDRYYSLRASVEQLADDDAFPEFEVKRIVETRSGSGISAISVPDGEEEGYVAIFKDGEKRKLKEERAGVESWHEIFPGLAPRILSYKKRGQSASLLIEHLAGLTFEQILLHEPPALVKQTLNQLGKTVGSIWKETRSDTPVSADFMRQLSRRLDEVYAIHPEFRQSISTICGYAVPSFDELLLRASDYEAGVEAPFSVYIHGDFNVDNIIYDPLEKKINYIDLHRSRYMDYVQDVSVFMVSNYRLQVLDKQLRKRILGVIRDFYRIARVFARKTGDGTFELRLALGLARSFVTSTRFILDKSLARAMFLRARYLIEQVLATEPKKAQAFRVPIKEIFIG
ncbi:MAG: PhoU domain-containing protein [Thiogranum sp.]